ncbi:MAG: DUF4386 domain-containing protein [Saprospiraceae bacterium]|nr:DUF4386 domain-containing protein [Saprospiraceae bacterium]
MENTRIESGKTIGILMIAGAVLLLIPYILLTVVFDYPDVLRADSGTVLEKFHEGGPGLVGLWFAFAIIGLPLIPAYIMLGQRLEKHLSFVRWVTHVGVVGLVVQMVGLLRWTFVVPVLARLYVSGTEAIRSAAMVSFQVIHQYGGVVLGEHLGQLFTIIWTVGMNQALRHLNIIPGGVFVLGYVASGIYLMAQAELLATVVPGFPVWAPAGLIGSTLWLIWLVAVGVGLLGRRKG